ncbi:MAG TPA: CsgG/HfaB family protein [Candidatus Acidoferrales bacterium]|nr:CsgG/HfaB family protein [Candidatus Acidoferrales bacterium]
MIPLKQQRSRGQRALCAVLALGLAGLTSVNAGCAARATRGGEGTSNPDLDRAAMSTTLDRDDITYLVDDYLKKLETSAFWQRVKDAPKPPVVAIWPIQNSTTQHLDDQMLTLLSSIETSLINTGRLRVVDRSSQESLAREIGVQHGAAYDPSTAQRMGRQLGAQYFFTGKITSVDERLNKTRRVQYTLFLQVIEIETGLIQFQNEVSRSKALEG